MSNQYRDINFIPATTSAIKNSARNIKAIAEKRKRMGKLF